MRYAQVAVQSPIEFINSGGVRFQIGPGEVNGVLDIIGYTSSERRIGKDRGLLEFNFGFADSLGKAYAYNNVLRPWVLWPGETIRVSDAGSAFKAHVNIKTVLDTRDTPLIRFADGRVLVSRHERNDVTLRVGEEERHLRVRLTVRVDEPASGAQQPYCSIEYQIPLEQLLWRRAPQFTPDDVLPEQEPYVPVRLTGGGVIKGVTPSPIVVFEGA